MKLELIGHELKYETEQIIYLFFPKPDDLSVKSIYDKQKNQVKTFAEAAGHISEHTEAAKTPCITKKELGNLVKKSAYFALKKLSRLSAPWGILTSIRPVKPVLDMLEDYGDADIVRKLLKEEFLVSDEKTNLALEVADFSKQYNKIVKKLVSIYIGIPFCPTRCHYCSFISGALNKTSNVAERYLEHLIREMEYTAEIIKRQNLKIDTIYIGGGTPTALSENLFRKLLEAVDVNFGNVAEYTVEAGRPDTITAEKLKLIIKHGVDRISINPQTTHDKTLEIIGRGHTFADFERAYSMARDMGIANINSDIIAALPCETPEMFFETAEKLAEMKPEGITVHTLYIKRTAWLKNIDFTHASQEDIAEMIRVSQGMLKKNGYMPYYMYKQRATLGNLENIGYSKPGFECIYNIKTMSDRQTIIALGAGAASKVVLDNRIERLFNFKNADDYILGFSSVLEKKRKLEEFLCE